MVSLLQAVRNAGANNVVILGGLADSSDFSQWVALVNNIPTPASRSSAIPVPGLLGRGAGWLLCF
jgi:S-formylglutathione hydrolase FrmB